MNLRKLLDAAVLLAAALSAVQCKNAEQEGLAGQSDGKHLILVATLEQPAGTKTALTSDRKVLWCAGDQIKVYNDSNPDGIVFTLDPACAGTSAGTFSGETLSGEGPFYAVYPAAVGGAFSKSSVSVTLPERQKYEAGSFGSGAAIAVARVEDLSRKLNFKNVLGGVAFTVTSDKTFIGVRLQTKGDEALSGSGTVSLDPEGKPVLTMAERSSDDNGFLYLDCPEAGVSASAASFILMLPPGAFASGFLVEFLDKESHVMFRGAKAQGSNTVVRSSILDMPAMEYTAQYRADFFESESFGYFKSIGAGQTPVPLVYKEETGQYAYLNSRDSRRVRVQDLQQETPFYAEISTPNQLTLGEKVEAQVTTVEGGTRTTTTLEYRVLQKSGNRVWLVNDTDQVGIIQRMED